MQMQGRLTYQIRKTYFTLICPAARYLDKNIFCLAYKMGEQRKDWVSVPLAKPLSYNRFLFLGVWGGGNHIPFKMSAVEILHSIFSFLSVNCHQFLGKC